MKLTALQNQLLAAIGQSDLANYFYWTGGTLLSAHYLHHRESEDLDFFSDDLIAEEVVLMTMQRIKRSLKLAGLSQRTHLNRQQYQLKKGGKTLKIEFVYFPFPAIMKPKKVAPWPVRVAQLKDIAANKIFALYERGEPKDAVDLFYIAEKKSWGIKQLTALASKKFGIDIDQAKLASQAFAAAAKLSAIKPLLTKEKNLARLKQSIEALFSSAGKTYLSTLLA
ncbi:MAG: nucleotidyl transferase AbiEii/AbiGii toxin family protein [Parcubacteria group bacterium]|nr:nucleotidyl transferase AbiEii/AbiGii toxin family protein [Parcubacteria group bacterium]